MEKRGIYMARKVPAMKRRKRNPSGVILIMMVSLILVVGVSTSSKKLENKLENYKIRQEQLELQIEAEKVRAEEIAEYAKFVQTDKFVEEIAKDKLGLVYEDEIVFKKK